MLTPMTTDRFRECLCLLGWSQRGLARLLDHNESRVREMARDASKIPPKLADWLEVRAGHAERNPAPVLHEPALPAEVQPLTDEPAEVFFARDVEQKRQQLDAMVQRARRIYGSLPD